MDAIVEWLRSRGAATIEHPGGRLLEHLQRTGSILDRWGSRPALVVAGLAHATYGTDGFGLGLLPVERRADLAGLVGDEAERIVYTYASCDRKYTYPQVGGEAARRFRDRFTGAELDLHARDATDFVTLTLANELDVLAHSDELREKHGRSLVTSFAGWSAFVTARAWQEFVAVATGAQSPVEHTAPGSDGRSSARER